ncbi:MAG: hypothetical protein IJP00_02880 [Firmicutes bacterium]|nr:hypothetical protein [Bacillota bacterium]
MAKYEFTVTADLDNFLIDLDNVVQESISATLEDTSNFSVGDVRCAVRVYERFSYMGGNRVSLNVTCLSKDEEVHVSAIASGGSQAVFFKINTFGEESFLEDVCNPLIEKYK